MGSHARQMCREILEEIRSMEEECAALLKVDEKDAERQFGSLKRWKRVTGGKISRLLDARRQLVGRRE